MRIPWTELTKKQLEARVYCRLCHRSNLVTANDNPFFWASFKDRPVKIQTCDHCKMPMRIRVARDGIEQLE